MKQTPCRSIPGRTTGSFLNVAGAVEGGLVLAALALAWLFQINLWADLHVNWAVLVHSLAALIPLIAFFLITYRWPWGPLRHQEILMQVMGPPLAACRWYDLILLAGMAGLGEELLFRGVLQTGLSHGTACGRASDWLRLRLDSCMLSHRRMPFSRD